MVDDTFGAMACWLDPGTRTSPDEHNQRELVIVQDGAGTIESDGVVELLAAGDVLLIERGHPHVLEASATGLTWLSVYWPRVEVPA
ncbi:cupin domain-containing protein [Cellulomonas dongxiuzhuiae]|uniref:cupin domain-containing protein n=1 Tax=Cellulomonas dongxiuzhuiae TaxID=2819979 RepID=UPI001AAF0EBB|nr:cupin domain-containing protein [Cellulomonas dongxiuzhuiae]